VGSEVNEKHLFFYLKYQTEKFGDNIILFQMYSGVIVFSAIACWLMYELKMIFEVMPLLVILVLIAVTTVIASYFGKGSAFRILAYAYTYTLFSFIMIFLMYVGISTTYSISSKLLLGSMFLGYFIIGGITTRIVYLRIKRGVYTKLGTFKNPTLLTLLLSASFSVNASLIYPLLAH
jgi:hypothetical protein